MSEGGSSELTGGLTKNERDDAVIAGYEDAKLRYIRAITERDELKLRDAFAKRREALNEEIASLRTVVQERKTAADNAVLRYATLCPNRVRKLGISPPSLWERIRSFNGVSRWYREARDAHEALQDVNALLRSRRDRLEELERETRRSIYLREESVRKRLQTPEGLRAMHADPLVKITYAKAKAVLAERAAYRERLERGDVPPEEARDRDMARRGLVFARIPMYGAMIARIERYGELEYYVLRELSNREYMLAADPRLEPLRDLVFDVTQGPLGYDAVLRYLPDGTPMRVHDHLKACFAPQDAAEMYARHRVALRTERTVQKTQPRDDAETELVVMLCMLAEAVATKVDREEGASGTPAAVATDAPAPAVPAPVAVSAVEATDG